MATNVGCGTCWVVVVLGVLWLCYGSVIVVLGVFWVCFGSVGCVDMCVLVVSFLPSCRQAT